ncbi:AraC family transcriptional regulator [Amycolatopsis sp. A1MSW2902]|uniref:GlxA family transcriptional regulator n=1 Tax=Amycolatopsis sp. A1MSW2902 TaxID=687413 RepID=UPI00307F6BC8
MRPRAMAPHRVVILVFDGVRTLDVAAPSEVFSSANDLGASYEVKLCSVSGSAVTTSAGVQLEVNCAVDAISAVDTLIIPGGECLAAERPPSDIVSAIRKLSISAKRIVPICAAVFALAEAQLLVGRRVTAHWRFVGLFRERYPDLEIDGSAAFVRDGRFLTSAGASSGLDVALALVEEDVDPRLAHEIARELVLFVRRHEGHPQLSLATRVARRRYDPVQAVYEAVVLEPAADHRLTTLARRVGISTRHLSRLCNRRVGLSPVRYVTSIRLEIVVDLLAAGETLASAARKTGIGSEGTLRRLLREHS